MKRYAVIVAGGSGTRMGAGMPKQFRSLCRRPVLWWSLKAFHDNDPLTRLIVVIPKDFISLWNDFYSSLPPEERYDHIVTEGGSSRGESVRNGLKLIDDLDSIVAVHDGARPLVDSEMISRGWEKAEEFGAAIPVIPVTDSLRLVDNQDHSQSLDRSLYRIVQTPQVFRTSLLQDAYNNAGEKSFTDDAAVVENNGHSVTMFEGKHENIKITNPKDMAVAALLMGEND